MEKTFSLELVTPIKLESIGDVTSIVAPGLDGYFGILKNHCLAMIALDIGCIKYKQNGEEKYLAISGGYADIKADNTLLLVETAEYAEDIDIDRSKESLSRAQDRLKEKKTDIDVERAEASMQRALNRMRIAEYR